MTKQTTDIPTLPELAQQIWRQLQRGAADARHAWHTPALATVAADGPRVRTVVLREVDISQRALVCHSDIRALKIEQLQAQPAVSWLFWDPRHQTQLRVQGRTTIHHQDEIATQAWQRLSSGSRRNYASSIRPGLPVADPQAGIAAYERTTSSPEEEEAWFAQFSYLRCEVDSFEWLRLSRDGHLRAQFQWEKGTQQASWLVP